MSATRLIKVVGFDLGETLIHYAGLPLNWQGLYGQALTRVAEACGHPITEADITLGEAILGRYNTRQHPRLHEVTADRVLGEVLAAWGLPVVVGMDQAEDAFFGFFQQAFAVYPDTLPALQALQSRWVRVGVLTDAPYGMPRRFVERDLAPIAACLDVALTSVEVGHRKPHPSGYLALAERLGVAPFDMAYVGNEEKDIVGANGAGMFSVLIDRTGGGAAFGQKRTITSLRKLAEWKELTD